MVGLLWNGQFRTPVEKRVRFFLSAPEVRLSSTRRCSLLPSQALDREPIGTLWENRVICSLVGDSAASLSNTIEFRNVVKHHADFLSALCPAEIREYQSKGIASFSV